MCCPEGPAHTKYLTHILFVEGISRRMKANINSEESKYHFTGWPRLNVSPGCRIPLKQIIHQIPRQVTLPFSTKAILKIHSFASLAVPSSFFDNLNPDFHEKTRTMERRPQHYVPVLCVLVGEVALLPSSPLPLISIPFGWLAVPSLWPYLNTASFSCQISFPA